MDSAKVAQLPYVGNPGFRCPLWVHRRNVHSQEGEDGLIRYLVDRLGSDVVKNKYFVEFGAWDGVHLSNTANLRLNFGWKGLLLEGDRERVEANKSIGIKHAMITSANINQLFDENGVPLDFDLLSIDIDSSDIYVWEALEQRYRPKIVILEYNPGLPNSHAIRVQETEAQAPERHGGAYFNANLNAMLDVAEKKGYTFVTCMNQNVVFVLNEHAAAIGVTKRPKAQVIADYGICSVTEFWKRGLLETNPEKKWIVDYVI